MSWLDTELAHQKDWSERERSIFDEGGYLGLAFGWWGGLIASGTSISPWEVVWFLVVFAVAFYLRLPTRFRKAWDAVEARVKRWAGL